MSDVTDTAPPDRMVSLRIMATTDLHMQVLDYDYLADRPCQSSGLTRIASLVARARSQAPNCLLLDNGDLLQGNPLGDYVAGQSKSGRSVTHPAIAAMNRMGYDAATPGNHDFNYGLPFMRRMLAQAGFPYVAANLCIRGGPDLPSHVILHRQMTDHAGRAVELRIGITGFLPPQTPQWDAGLARDISCDDIIPAAQRVLPRMRAEGAQLIIALAHSGIGPARSHPGMEHAATALAGLADIDVVIAGHSHLVFPGPQLRASAEIDPVRGSLAGKPAVMAGSGGSHLGIVDLRLLPSGDRLRVGDFAVQLQQAADAPPDPAIAAPALALHRELLRGARRRIGRLDMPLNSYFSLLGQDRGLRLVNMAQRWYLRRHLRGTALAGLPVLSAAAPFRGGGRGGAQHYTDIPAGPLRQRNLADLYLFPNHIAALLITGAELAEWLERSAGLYRQIRPGLADQPLIDPDFPSYHFDLIEGVQWQIDPSQPARFAADGRFITDSQRIGNLCWRGQPVAADQQFVLATNTYRLADCGLFAPLVARSPVVLRAGPASRQVLRDYIRRRPRPAISGQRHFSFATLPATSAIFETGPGALAHLAPTPPDLPGPLRYLDSLPNGFARLQLDFG